MPDYGAVVETPQQRAPPESAGGSGNSVSKPLPAWEKRLPAVYLVVLTVIVAGLVVYPRNASSYDITLALTVLMTISLASSWNIISGFTGYISFGHAGFFGVGAYAGSLLIFHDVVPWQAAMVLAGLLTAGIALVIGFPTLRLRGPYFAITMLGLAELAGIVVTAWESLTRGGVGVYLPIIRNPKPNYYAMLMLAVAAVVVSYFIATSRFGLRLLSIRDDEVAAQAMGIDTTRNKMAAFVISSFFPGAAGAIYARHVGFIDPPTVFLVIWTIRSIATTIVGGQGTILGPIIGAVILTLVSEEVWARDPNLYQVIFGGIIVVVVMVMPGGLIGLLQNWGILPRSRRL